MIRTEIFIENKPLELSVDISAQFTYAVDDLKDFAARNSSFSKTIIIPGNANNNKLFGHIFEFGSANFYDETIANVGYNFNAGKSASCVILIDRIQIFKGVLRLLEITIDRGVIDYEVSVFGELGGFVSAMANKKIEELDFSAYNQTWNSTNIINSWDTINGSGVYYPLIDYGQLSTLKHDWDFKAFRPALYVREYMTKIITGAGYTWESPFFDTELFKRLVIPNNQKTLSGYSTNGFSGGATGRNYTGTSVSSIPIEITPTTLGSFTMSVGNTVATYGGASTVSGTLTVYMTGLWSTATAGTFYLKKNGTIVSSYYVGIGGTFGYFNASLVSSPISFSSTDYWTVTFEGSFSSYNLSIYTSAINFVLDSSQSVPLNYGESIPMNETIPKGIFQRDFVSSIMKMFNLMITESPTIEKHLVIEPYIDFFMSEIYLDVTDDFLVNDTDLLILEDHEQSINWSDKIDRSKPFKVKPMSEINGRYFEYKYKSDTDYFNEQYSKKYSHGYGDRLVDTGFDWANDKKTAEIIFAASVLKGVAGEEKIFPAIYKLSNNNTTEDPIDHVIRILQAKKITGVASWDLKNGATILSSLTNYGYGGHLDDPDVPTSDINFGAPNELNFSLAISYPSANLFNGFWSDYIAEISNKDSKLLSCWVKLTEQNILDLDFSKLIWIDGALWRLNKVVDFNPMDPGPTMCEFSKVIETTYA